MGTAKALLPFDGEPLITHLVRTLHTQFQDLVIVAAPGQDLPPLSARLVRDEVAYQGPASGIYYGLQAIEGEMAFVTSCDSVFVCLPLVRHLVASAGDVAVVVPKWEDRLQPLTAVYRKRVLPVVEQQLATGELRLTSVFDKVSTRVIEPDEIRRFDPTGASFLTMNTPAEYEHALARWRADAGN
jgi:molybdopterin-guanine dinucleotide biosynthesis protein A